MRITVPGISGSHGSAKECPAVRTFIEKMGTLVVSRTNPVLNLVPLPDVRPKDSLKDRTIREQLNKLNRVSEIEMVDFIPVQLVEVREVGSVQQIIDSCSCSAAVICFSFAYIGLPYHAAFNRERREVQQADYFITGHK